MTVTAKAAATHTARRHALRGLAMASGAVLLAAACGNPKAPEEGASSTSAASGEGVPAAWSAVTDPKKIPLGDGKVATSAQKDAIYSCRTSFRQGGARHDGPWFDNENKTWDSTAKVRVQGEHSWPDAEYNESTKGDSRNITSKNLPTQQVTGTFPIERSDPAYQYDTNPNAIEPETVDFTLPLNPTRADSPSCVDMGAIGVLKNGVYIYNSLDDAGRDAAAHETQDVCDGHPDGAEAYHYHNIPSCLLAAADKKGATLVGYALDGFGIYVERDDKGNLPTNADLDECHGRTSKVMWNGKETSVYHYSATLEFPYTVGCFRGTPVEPPEHDRTGNNHRGRQRPGQGGQDQGQTQGQGQRQRPGQAQGQSQGQGQGQGHH
ncbi:YHYH protein [Streptomyces sp. NPDC127084]|uniref:YHYH protein n=1 Tax=Streptomyces sp. NPDC127084 TaxID=3347133 RepID=UPI003655AD81